MAVRKAGTPPNSTRITADSATLSCPGAKNEPTGVLTPQPHQQVPVGKRRCCPRSFVILGWLPRVASLERRAGLFGVVGRVGAARSILLGRWWRRRDRPGPVGDDADPLALAVAGEVALDVDGGAGL